MVFGAEGSQVFHIAGCKYLQGTWKRQGTKFCKRQKRSFELLNLPSELIDCVVCGINYAENEKAHDPVVAVYAMTACKRLYRNYNRISSRAHVDAICEQEVGLFRLFEKERVMAAYFNNTKPKHPCTSTTSPPLLGSLKFEGFCYSADVRLPHVHNEPDVLTGMLQCFDLDIFSVASWDCVDCEPPAPYRDWADELGKSVRRLQLNDMQLHYKALEVLISRTLALRTQGRLRVLDATIDQTPAEVFSVLVDADFADGCRRRGVFGSEQATFSTMRLTIYVVVSTGFGRMIRLQGTLTILNAERPDYVFGSSTEGQNGHRIIDGRLFLPIRITFKHVTAYVRTLSDAIDLPAPPTPSAPPPSIKLVDLCF